MRTVLALLAAGAAIALAPTAGAEVDNTSYDDIHPTKAGLCSTDPLWPRLSEFCNRDNPYDDSGGNGPEESPVLLP